MTVTEFSRAQFLSPFPFLVIFSPFSLAFIWFLFVYALSFTRLPTLVPAVGAWRGRAASGIHRGAAL